MRRSVSTLLLVAAVILAAGGDMPRDVEVAERASGSRRPSRRRTDA
jgi:hypothetical protein